MSQNIRSLEQGFIFVYKDEETEILTLTRGAVGNFSNFTFVFISSTKFISDGLVVLLIERNPLFNHYAINYFFQGTSRVRPWLGEGFPRDLKFVACRIVSNLTSHSKNFYKLNTITVLYAHNTVRITRRGTAPWGCHARSTKIRLLGLRLGES